MSLTRTGRTITAVSLVMVMTAGQLLTIGSAKADPIADKQKQASEIAAKLQQLERDVEHNANEYEAAQTRLAAIRSEISANDQRLAEARSQLQERRDELTAYAVNAYVNGGSDAGMAPAIVGALDESGARQAYTTATTGDRQQLVDNLDAAERDATDRQEELDRTKQQAERAVADADERRKAADAATKQYQQLNSQVQGELQVLVEQKRQAEERAREEHAYQEALAQARRTAPPASNPSGAQRGVVAPPPRPTPGGSPPPVIPSNGGKGAAAVQVAMTKLGSPYVWGAAGPNTFDCSGLTQWAYRQVGISLPRVTWDQERAGRVVPVSQIQVGDLVFYDGGGHMGMYAGGGQVIHAPRTGDVVKLSSLYMMPVELVVRVA